MKSLVTANNAQSAETKYAEARAVAELMPLVHQVVARFLRKLPRNVLRDDLVAAGTFGLLDAIRRGGDTTGPAFEWYARVRIRGAIVDELRTQDWLSRRERNKVTASMKEGEPVSGVLRTAVVAFDDLPLDVQARELADETAADPLTMVEQRMESEALASVVATLPERERGIVRAYYFDGVPFKTIAANLGVSEPRVSQLHSRAMQLLKAKLNEQNAETAVA